MSTRRVPRSLDAVVAFAVALGALLLYLTTMAPGVVSIADDSLEFQLLAQRAAIPHPTGYPLYAILLAAIARGFPFGEVAWRANLLSGLAASGAVGLTFLVGRQMGLQRMAALFGAGLFALSPTFWSQATLAEVYALHHLLVAAMGLALLRWQPHRGAPVWAALFVGLGMAHHRMIVLWLPAVALYTVWVGRKSGGRAGRHLARPASQVILALCLPLLLYLWLPLRATVGSIDGSYDTVGFGCWVRACLYEQSFFGRDNELAQRVPAAFYAFLTRDEIGWLGVGLAGVGMAWLWRASRARGALMGLGLLANAAFAMNYVVPDREAFWVPTLWVLALLAGWGAQAVNEIVTRSWHGRGAWALQGALGLALTAALLLPAGATRTQVDRSGIAGPADFNGQDVLAQPLPPDAVIVALLGEATYLRYLQEARDISPEVATLALPTDPPEARFAAIEAAIAAGQRPFLTRELPGAGARWSLSALGPLAEVRATPQDEVPAALWSLQLPATDALTLAAWGRSPIAGSSLERVTVAWAVHAPVERALKVSARLIAADGNTLHQTDSFPVHGAYPTPLWRPGEIILDTYSLPPAPPDAHYQFILYLPDDGSEVARVEWAP